MWLTDLLARFRPAIPSTAGGDPPAHPTWDGGRYSKARQAPAHPGRVGGAIRPWAIVLHATSMRHETFDALVKSWQSRPAEGNCAHFIVGRDESQGLVQCVDVTRNANHAGGAVHGWFTSTGGNGDIRRYHPNAVSIAIEVHNAGEVRRIGSDWRTGDYGKGGWKPAGAPLDASDVVVYPGRQDRGWHRPTVWQLDTLRTLLEAIGSSPDIVVPPKQWSCTGTATAQPWALRRTIHGVPLVGHETLDAAGRGDPGRVISEWVGSLPS